MHMVSNVLIILGCADIGISVGALDTGPMAFSTVSPIIGVITLFFGVYTERKTLSLALKQTLAVTAGSFGAGFTLYFMRWYVNPELITSGTINPPIAVVLGIFVTVVGLGYYLWTRRVYTNPTSITKAD